MSLKEYKPGTAFSGVIGRTFDTSEPVWPEPNRAKEAAKQLRFEFEVTGKPDVLKGKGTPGHGQLYIDGELVGQVEMDVTNPIMLGLASGAAVGADPGSPVTDSYQAPFEYTGKLYRVTIDVSGEFIQDTEAEMRAVMARQ
jgi:arylsulfatase